MDVHQPERAVVRAQADHGTRGADERTGWRESSVYDGLDLPEENESARPSPARVPDRRVNGLPWYWWCVGVALLLFIGLAFLGLL